MDVCAGPLKCPTSRCKADMDPKGDGAYECPNGHRWLDDSPDVYAVPIDASGPTAVSLSYVPGAARGGGGSSGRSKSPAMQKMDAWRRRQMPGAHARGN